MFQDLGKWWIYGILGYYAKCKMTNFTHSKETLWFRFIFEAYENLLNERITPDEFLAIWDITSHSKLSTNSEASIPVVDSIIQWKNDNENTLFILDSISFLVLSNNDKKIVQEWAKNHKCELVFC